MSRIPVVPERDVLPTEAMIATVVEAFYDKVRGDDLLAPVFGPRLEGRWEEHMPTMVDFWSSILLSSRRYQGRPLSIHAELGEITPAMWRRWLALFAETAHEHCPTPAADLFVSRSEQIASHLSRSIAHQREQTAAATQP